MMASRPAMGGEPYFAVNLPNSITMSRIFCVPLLIWILSPAWPIKGVHGEQEIFACAVFILASMTDGLDGYLARRRGQITAMGMLLDPLADKLMVTAAYIALVEFNPHIVKPWIAVIVIGREFLVSGLRSIAATEGLTIAASDLGKLKMVTQIVSVVAAILDHRWLTWKIGWFELPVHIIAVEAIWFMVLVSVLSAADYFLGFWKQIAQASDRRREANLLTRKKAISPAK
jgi:CDP-diacylglycerol--glycerol-3-phosphate 3-phosphatidyltransferase